MRGREVGLSTGGWQVGKSDSIVVSFPWTRPEDDMGCLALLAWLVEYIEEALGLDAQGATASCN
jgi:hypothetical protein